MPTLKRPAALAAAAALVAALVACTPPPEPTPTTSRPATPQPTAAETIADPTAGATHGPSSTPLPTPEVTLDEELLWAGMTSHCESIGTLMRVDDHPRPLVHGLYAPVDLHDSGPREGARGQVLTRMDGSPDSYLPADGDDLTSIGQRFCAPHPDYIAWLNHYDDAAAMPVAPVPLSLLSSEPAGEGEDMPVPTELL